MEFDSAHLKEIVASHLPVFYIHPSDRFLPCSVDYFMQHSSLRSKNPDGTTTILIPAGQVRSGEQLLHLQHQYSSSKLWLQLNPAARCGQPLSEINSVPVYAHVKCVLRVDGTPEALEINYITLYAHNGSYKVAGWFDVGAHDGDIEHISARVRLDGSLLGMWYNSHRSRDGEWVAAKDVPRNEEGRPIAYVALNGHGTYPKDGTINRHFFLGNDRCSSKGPIWKPSRVILLPHVQQEPLPEAGFPLHHLGEVFLDKADNIEVAVDNVGESMAIKGAVNKAGVGGMGSNRPVVACRSRGSSLTEEATDTITAPGTSNPKPAPSLNIGCVEVVTDDACEWLFFKGDWGTTPAAIEQAWFHTAETPVSRKGILRVFGHFVPETERV